jgi:hypothetical protein
MIIVEKLSQIALSHPEVEELLLAYIDLKQRQNRICKRHVYKRN